MQAWYLLGGGRPGSELLEAENVIKPRTPTSFPGLLITSNCLKVGHLQHHASYGCPVLTPGMNHAFSSEYF